MTTYRQAGVDLEATAQHVGRIGPMVTSTWGKGVVGNFGGFAAGVTIPDGYRSPVLMLTTDGVGTKLDLARRVGRWDGVGADLVAMVVDDLAAVGAKPIGLVDYMAVGALDSERDAAIVSSIAAACIYAGCPLLGGETAEHPGVMAADQVDLAATALGVVERGAELGPQRVVAGDVVIGLVSPNLRSNGFSLVRAVIEHVDLDQMIDGHRMSDVLLSPSVIYSPQALRASATGLVHAAAHITGGGLMANLARVMPDELRVVLNHAAWEVPDVFRLVQRWGDVSAVEMSRTFNMGIGFCLIASPGDAARLIDLVGHDARVIGEIIARAGS